MSHGPNYLYSDAMNACTLCSAHLKDVSALGIYLVVPRGAIHYPLCPRCAKSAQKGLSPEQLRTLDQRLEARAGELGLTQTQ